MYEDKTFLQLYGQIASGNEAPKEFHIWAGLSVIASCIGRRVWINRADVPPVYSNMYIVFTTPPGTKKSTALGIAKRFIRSLKDIPVAPSSVTKPQIIVMMDNVKDDAPCRKVFKYKGKVVVWSEYCIFANEFINQLNAGADPIGMIDFLTDVWDQPSIEDETKNRGKYYVEGPFVNILAAMTNSTATSLNNQKIISAGMLRRCLFICGEDSGEDIPRPDLIWDPESADIKAELTRRSKFLMTNICGEFEWTTDGNTCWDKMYREIAKKKRSDKSSPLLTEFYQSKPEYIQKVAMLLQLSKDPTKLILTKENFMLAYELVTQVEMGGVQLFEGHGKNVQSGSAVEIIRMCELEFKPILDKTVFRIMHKDMTYAEFTQTIDDLCRADKLLKFEIKEGGVISTFISTPEKGRAYMAARRAAIAGKPSGTDSKGVGS